MIASLAFHPSDRVLVIATYNEVYFWDWSRPEPFAHVATSNAKEKVSTCHLYRRINAKKRLFRTKF